MTTRLRQGRETQQSHRLLVPTNLSGGYATESSFLRDEGSDSTEVASAAQYVFLGRYYTTPAVVCATVRDTRHWDTQFRCCATILASEITAFCHTPPVPYKFLLQRSHCCRHHPIYHESDTLCRPRHIAFGMQKHLPCATATMHYWFSSSG